MGSIFSAIGRGINAIISAIANVIMAIVGAITMIIVSIFHFIGDVICCRFGSRKRHRSSSHSTGRSSRRKGGVGSTF